MRWAGDAIRLKKREEVPAEEYASRRARLTARLDELIATEWEDKDAKREDSEKKDCRMDESAKEEEHKAGEELSKGREKQEREDRARSDASTARESRELRGQIEALQAQITRLYKEPSYEDRNALAEARARADATFQAVSGKPASEPHPGESPISYRKRMADGLRKYSAKFKAERVDSLSGAAFDIVEQQIYADAAAAAKMPENLPAGQLRKIVRNDSGHVVTEYTGDPKAAWRNFSTGAVLGIRLKEPARAA
ncbi:MAG: hypothetical protein B7X10_00120 [Burkholderiales bacterium 21-58-4]|nr:MAG: hypothetical protein B7X10_00120 [Burkholderiales bacterium 21-58-4]